ncbi:MAG: LysR family transcriptional regulator [Betaproteobacteria bacterium]|jgi:DNA-binding transcriptional LysR family regulator|nr:LysR family transcriptional regulator [Betaproteobacteria bacterium]NDB43718.1 LysR family transcriptional regulator [Betaproteobacteria bacterium]
MELAKLDLNLLLVFHHLLILKRVSAVANLLNMSQPAVSSALGRLRSSLNDDLFIRTQGGMTPTPYALQLAEPIAMALNGLQQALNVRGAFDPKTSRRNFTIALTDVGEMYFLPVLVNVLAKVAPGVTLQIVSVAQSALKEDMSTGRIDLAMGLLPQLQAGFFQQSLFKQKYVCLMRKKHPLTQATSISVAALFASEHVRVLATGTGHGKVDAAMDQQKYSRQVRLTVPHYVALGDVLQNANLIAVVPERFAQRIVKPFDLVMRDLPIKVENSAIQQCWHGRLHRDPGHQWLRQLMRELFGDRSTGDEELAI